MFRFFIFILFSITFSKAQQLESLKILKTKHDSIETSLRLTYQEHIKGKSDKEINEIYFDYLLKRNNNNRERLNNYKTAVKEFLSTQKLAEPSEVSAIYTTEKMASYSFGFQELYKEVHDFVKKKYDNDRDYFSNSAKIHFIVQNDNSLFIERVEGKDEEFNDTVLLAFLMTKGNWEAAQQSGRPVKSKFMLPIKFVVEE